MSLQPGAHSPASHTVPSGQSPSPRQPLQVLLPTSHLVGALQSVSSLQPGMQPPPLGSQNCPMGQFASSHGIAIVVEVPGSVVEVVLGSGPVVSTVVVPGSVAVSGMPVVSVLPVSVA